MKSSVFTIIGFLMFFIGVIALVLSLIGLRLSFLSFVDDNATVGLVVKLSLIIIGLMMVYLTKTITVDRLEA